MRVDQTRESSRDYLPAHPALAADESEPSVTFTFSEAGRDSNRSRVSCVTAYR